MADSIGHVNAYVCSKCRLTTFTINLNTATTPFGIKCPQCGDLECYSSIYNLDSKVKDYLNIQEAFYLPTKEEFDTLHPEMKQYVLQGAMLHGPITKVLPLRPDPDEIKTYGEWKALTLAVYGKVAK